METDPEHVLYQDSSSSGNQEQHNNSKTGWKDAFVMFTTWTLDNLFWLTPFVAHSIWNAAWFVATYQVLIFVSCIFISPEASLSSAHALNNLYGMSGALFCWILGYCFYVQFQRRFHHQVAASLRNSTSGDIEEAASDLKAPPVKHSSHHHKNSPDSIAIIPHTVPQVWMIVTMTLVTALDDVLYVPTMVQENHIFSISDICIASFLAVSL
jgi:hypothetical protein